MAQLSDDCFAFNGPLLPVADAERLIAERVSPVSECETVTLREAMGRVLAETSSPRSMCRRSIIPPWTAMRCAPPISMPKVKRG